MNFNLDLSLVDNISAPRRYIRVSYYEQFISGTVFDLDPSDPPLLLPYRGTARRELIVAGVSTFY